MVFQPTLGSVQQHVVPDWFHDAKLGIFIHWGLYSVPAWAPNAGDLSQVEHNQGWREWFKNNSYAEWYLNSLKFEDGATRIYHDKTYGPDFAYDDFVPQFNQAVLDWQPDDMASLFQKVGARYVVLTSKHHDGFTLWPSQHPCPNKSNYQASRDIVGELTAAVRRKGMRMGLYYSGGLDWAFNPTRIEDSADVRGTIVQDPDFVEYSVAHWRELTDRYQPSLMWNDIGFPSAPDVAELFAYYYNHVPDGVINDRFAQLTDAQLRGEVSANGEAYNPHFDFLTPEYAKFDDIHPKKWESTRGIGHSFGYNRNETDVQLLSETELIHMFIDIVSKNGNLLLNVGPMADGTIPQNQRLRLEGFGEWLTLYGEAIFGTRPWHHAISQTTDGLGVRFTQQGDALYATLLGTPASTQVTIKGLVATTDTTVTLLGHGGVLKTQQQDDGLTVTLPDALPDWPAHALKLLGVTGDFA
ncbi:MAG: alpha-L-fucosidase [Anaerolineae bacterium]|nr:alpha-L-fucosidase [Anaerolineae bacterium]